MSTTQASENTRIARRFPEEIATDQRLDLIDDICSPDIIDRTPLGVTHGREELKESMRYLFDAFPDFSAKVEDSVAEGDMVATRVTLRATHDGEFMGIEPTGQMVEVQNMVFTRVEDGAIAERWVQPDMLSVFQQLGIIELPEAGSGPSAE